MPGSPGALQDQVWAMPGFCFPVLSPWPRHSLFEVCLSFALKGQVKFSRRNHILGQRFLP